jgi:hypothetical protein
MTATIAPSRTHEQRMESLRGANHIRSWRAAMKVKLKAGEWTATEVLRAMPPEVASMRVDDFLIAAPKFGPVKVRKVLRCYAISPARSLAALTDRQREALLLELPRPQRR